MNRNISTDELYWDDETLVQDTELNGIQYHTSTVDAVHYVLYGDKLYDEFDFTEFYYICQKFLIGFTPNSTIQETEDIEE